MNQSDQPIEVFYKKETRVKNGWFSYKEIMKAVPCEVI
jgi:hypothetical protein